ncbi:MAG: hypothetical protein OEZ39_09505 [Gammaproteobacteria bacterium]|nr:hypothetical protein [Gammaproteobacteria bacterium]
MSEYKHIAVIPARAGSVGFPGKNRIFFDNTADFLDGIGWFDSVIVSTDDPEVIIKASARGYIPHQRPDELAGPAVSIKAVFEELISSRNIPKDTILWLFYLPVLYKSLHDFENAKVNIENKPINSLCTFIPAVTHPYTVWKYDDSTHMITKYIENDVFRRQDMPPAWMHYHYVCCFKAGEIAALDSELLNKNTHPVFLSEEQAKNLVEIDTPADLEKWEALQNSKNRG